MANAQSVDRQLVKRCTVSDPDYLCLERMKEDPLVEVFVPLEDCTDYVKGLDGGVGISRCKSINVNGFQYNLKPGLNKRVPLSIRENYENAKQVQVDFKRHFANPHMLNRIQLGAIGAPVDYGNTLKNHYADREVIQDAAARRRQHIEERKKEFGDNWRVGNNPEAVMGQPDGAGHANVG